MAVPLGCRGSNLLTPADRRSPPTTAGNPSTTGGTVGGRCPRSGSPFPSPFTCGRYTTESRVPPDWRAPARCGGRPPPPLGRGRYGLGPPGTRPRSRSRCGAMAPNGSPRRCRVWWGRTMPPSTGSGPTTPSSRRRSPPSARPGWGATTGCSKRSSPRSWARRCRGRRRPDRCGFFGTASVRPPPGLPTYASRRPQPAWRSSRAGSFTSVGWSENVRTPSSGPPRSPIGWKRPPIWAAPSCGTGCRPCPGSAPGPQQRCVAPRRATPTWSRWETSICPTGSPSPWPAKPGQPMSGCSNCWPPTQVTAPGRSP